VVCVCILLLCFVNVGSTESAAVVATIPVAAPSRHRISVDAFHRMGETGILRAKNRLELIDDLGERVSIELARLLPPVG
jgi:hypothetical protein